MGRCSGGALGGLVDGPGKAMPEDGVRTSTAWEAPGGGWEMRPGNRRLLALTHLTGPLIVVATGNLLDLEETAKAPLSTVSANTTNMDEAPRPQGLNNSSVVWVSGHVAWGPHRDPSSLHLIPGLRPKASLGPRPWHP